MNVILLYGPPGVGKFTVSKELSKVMKYKMVHIHSIYDFLEDIFGKDQYEISLKILNDVYLKILKEIVKNKEMKGFIFLTLNLQEIILYLLDRLNKYV